MTTQAELFDKARKCDELMQCAPDQQTTQALGQARDMWIDLANHSLNMSPKRLADEIARIEEILLQRGAD